MVTNPLQKLAYIQLNQNLTRKDLKCYAMVHKFVRFIRKKDNSKNSESRRERIHNRSPESLTFIAGKSPHMVYQTAVFSPGFIHACLRSTTCSSAKRLSF